MPFESTSKAELDAMLRELHAPAEPPERSPERERELLLAWAERYDRASADADAAPAPSFALVLELLGAHRFAVAAVVLLMTLVGACVLPTSYEVPLGLSLEIHAAPGTSIPAPEIAKFIQTEGEAAEVDVMVRELMREGEQRTVMQVRLWDQSFELGELTPSLRARFPSLARAEIVETPLEGEVETIWGRRFAHVALDFELRDADVEQARAHLLMRLHQQGLSDEEVSVEVRDHGGHREVEVRIEQHRSGAFDVDELDGLGPGFDWKLDPNAPQLIELPAQGGTVQLKLREE